MGSLLVGFGLGFGILGFTFAGIAITVLFSIGGLSVTGGLLSIVGVALIAGLCVGGLGYVAYKYTTNQKQNGANGDLDYTNPDVFGIPAPPTTTPVGGGGLLVFIN